MARGRPLSEAARAFIAAVSTTPKSSRTVAAELQLSRRHADKLAYTLTAAGHIEVVAREERKRRRPVWVYAKRGQVATMHNWFSVAAQDDDSGRA